MAVTVVIYIGILGAVRRHITAAGTLRASPLLELDLSQTPKQVELEFREPGGSAVSSTVTDDSNTLI